MEVKFRYGFDLEEKRIIDHSKARKFLLDNKYPEPIMPEGVSLYNDPDKNILKALKKDYEEEEYKLIKRKLEENIQKKLKKFSKFIEKTFGKDSKKTFIVNLSKYGLGSYFPPDTIEVNFKRDHFEKLLWTIFHEIVHIYFEPYVEKYKLTHWEKERIVDLILDIWSNEKTYWQKNYHNTNKYIDNAFKELFFKNKEEFFKKIKKNAK